MPSRDLSLDLDVATSIAANSSASGVNGTGVDLAGCEGALIVVSSGDDPTAALAVEESDDNSTWAAVDAADLMGDALDTTPAASSVLAMSYVGSKRYVRVTTSDASDACALVIKGHLRHAGGDAA